MYLISQYLFKFFMVFIDFIAVTILSQFSMLFYSWLLALLVGNYVIYNLQAVLLFVTGN